MRYYFLLRVKLLERQLIHFGVNPIVACAAILIGFILFSFYIFAKAPYPSYMYAGIAAAVVGTLGTKNRNNFLKIIFSSQEFRFIRILENALLVLPFIIFLFFKTEFILAGILFVVTSIMAILSFNSNFNFVIPTPFYKTPFEFLVGFRKSIIVIMALYYLIFMAMQYDNFGLAVFSLIILFFTFMGFYFNPEDVFYVWIFSSNPKQFILGKIKTAVLNVLLLTLPIVLCLIFFFLEHKLIILLIELAGIILVITCLLSKYAQFPLSVSPTKLIALVFSAWFPPLIIGFAIVFYIQSNKRLKTILA